jgi:hypothetical protein
MKICVLSGAFKASRYPASVRNTKNGEKVVSTRKSGLKFVQQFSKVIILSSNASRVSLQYYLNKKGKGCKARVNEWRIDQT